MTDLTEMKEGNFVLSRIDITCDCKNEIRGRMMIGRRAKTDLTEMWKDRDVSIATKKRMVQVLIVPVVMYAYESWDKEKLFFPGVVMEKNSGNYVDWASY